MQPLVLAIEPDLRQAAIVKRIVREKVLADVTVVDSRDAALEAMRTMIPDVLLLSALLSPRDEDELIAHLRTRRDAEHLQTHTIPLLSSSLGGDEEDDRPKGLLSAFRRKKASGPATVGCDPDLFADEIRTYLKRASDKKREVRDTGAANKPVGAGSPVASPVTHARAAQPVAAEEPAASASSSWDSPFEWRPAGARTAPPPVAAEPEPRMPEPFVPEPFVPEPVSLIHDPSSIDDPKSVIFDRLTSILGPPADAPAEPYESFFPQSLEHEPEPSILEPVIFRSEPQAETEYVPSIVLTDVPDFVEDSRPILAEVAAPRAKYPLTMRTAKGWWFVEGKESASGDPDSEVRAVLAGLAVPMTIAGVAYAEGCRIRRVRLNDVAA